MRRELVALLVLVAVLVGGWAGYRLVFEGLGGRELTLESVQGQVRHVTGASGADALAGEIIRPGERLEAGPDGAAVLSFGAETRVALRPDSSMKVLAVQEDGVRVALENGRVQATVREGGAPVAVTAGGRDITARDADVTVARTADGTVGVEATRGTAELSGFGAETSVGAGARVIAPEGGAATRVAAGQEQLLSLAATPRRISADAVEVRGTTEPNARVTILGGLASITTAADRQGAFSARVPLREGQNHLEVRASDVLGHEVGATAEVERDTTGPGIDVYVPLAP